MRKLLHAIHGLLETRKNRSMDSASMSFHKRPELVMNLIGRTQKRLAAKQNIYAGCGQWARGTLRSRRWRTMANAGASLWGFVIAPDQPASGAIAIAYCAAWSHGARSKARRWLDVIRALICFRCGRQIDGPVPTFFRRNTLRYCALRVGMRFSLCCCLDRALSCLTTVVSAFQVAPTS
jgi:hypothetical protein